MNHKLLLGSGVLTAVVLALLLSGCSQQPEQNAAGQHIGANGVVIKPSGMTSEQQKADEDAIKSGKPPAANNH